MATITPARLGPGTLTFTIASKATQFAAKCQSVELNGELPDDGGTALLNHDEYFEDAAKFGTIGGTIIQEYTMTALEVWCYQNAGKEAEYIFIPANTGGYKATGTCKIKPVKLGGNPKKVNTTDFSFDLVGGLPTFTAVG